MAMKKICAGIAAAMLISSAAMAADKDDTPSEVNADAIEYDMNTGLVAASGNVFVKRGEPNQEQHAELNADAVQYDLNTGLVTAAGNILLKHGLMKATGLHAVFNAKTKAAQLIGNVIVVREDMRITCNTLASSGQGYMVADGNVIATQTLAPNEKYPEGDTRTFTGEHIDYFPDEKKHFVIPRGGVAKSVVDGTFTADIIEGWIDDEHYVGTGNAHLVSPARNMEAGGDMVDYSGKDAGKAVLSGNAWAHQNNNTIRGNRLTVYLADDGKLKAENSTPNPGLPKLELPKLEVPQMPTVDNAFEKMEQDTVKRLETGMGTEPAPVAEDDAAQVEHVDTPFADGKTEPAQTETVPDNKTETAQDKPLVPEDKEGDEIIPIDPNEGEGK